MADGGRGGAPIRRSASAAALPGAAGLRYPTSFRRGSLSIRRLKREVSAFAWLWNVVPAAL